MVSVGNKIKKLAGMVGTSDLNAKDSKFVSDMVQQTNNGQNTQTLSFAQCQYIEGIHDKHFAG